MKASIINDKGIKDKWKGRMISIGFWLLLWQLVSMWVGQELLLVAPVSVLITLFDLVQQWFFWRAVAFSILRIMVGFSLALLLGVVLAVIAYLYQSVKVLMSPMFTAIKATPVASFVILALVWFSSKNLSIVTSFLMVLPLIYTNVLQGLYMVDPKMLEMVTVFRVSRWRRLRYIYLPAVMPYFLSACMVSLGLCWKAGVAAKVIGLPADSIGQQLYYAKIYLNTPELFAWTTVIIIINIFLEKFFGKLINRVNEGASYE